MANGIAKGLSSKDGNIYLDKVGAQTTYSASRYDISNRVDATKAERVYGNSGAVLEQIVLPQVEPVVHEEPILTSPTAVDYETLFGDSKFWKQGPTKKEQERNVVYETKIDGRTLYVSGPLTSDVLYKYAEIAGMNRAQRALESFSTGADLLVKILGYLHNGHVTDISVDGVEDAFPELIPTADSSNVDYPTRTADGTPAELASPEEETYCLIPEDNGRDELWKATKESKKKLTPRTIVYSCTKTEK